jgi:branched-chain amino acid transport system substrate-binding protein
MGVMWGTRTRTAAIGLVTALVLAACGTRLPDEAFVEDPEEALLEGEQAAEGLTDGVTDTVDGTTEDTVPGAEATAGGDGGDGGTTGGTTGGTGGGASGPNQASDVGITATTITLGNITAESGFLGDAFAPAVRGLRAWVQATNAKGGLNGRQIILKTCDDQENRSRVLQCARKLVEQDKVFALVATNTRAMGGAATYLQDKGVPVIGMPINNSFNRFSHFWSGYGSIYKRDNKTVGHNGDLVSLSGVSRWFRQKLGTKKAAVVFYDIAESKQAGDFLREGLELEGFTVQPYTVSFAAPNFDSAIADMERRGIEIIFDAIDDGANRRFCDRLQGRLDTLKAKVSTVVIQGQNVGKEYKEDCRNKVYVAGSTITYAATSVPEVAAFRSAFAKYQPGVELHQWALEAWMQANMVAEGITKMGGSPTRKGLEDYLRSLKRYTGKGLSAPFDYRPVDFSKKTMEDCFSISRWQDSKGGWVDAGGRFPFCYPDAKVYSTPAAEQGT